MPNENSYEVALQKSNAIREGLTKTPEKFTMLTGDRPTGRLHLGHYFGTLKGRVELQNMGAKTNVLIADYQVITDRDTTEHIQDNVYNMVMDYLFMAVFRWGLPGAAMATALSQSLGGLIPLVYFSRPNGSLFRLGKASLDKRALAKACINGSSELMSNISMSLVGMLYNLQLLKYAGEDGVAAYGVLMYVNMVFLSIFIGYSTGVAPVVGFHFGAGNRLGLHSLLKKSSAVILVSSAAMFGAAELLGRPLAKLFVGYDP
ncbi:MAG: hypothetical protein KH283_08980, partial [Collinsella sp.]|nr:hypothetical protein [Collinsella sp.]